MGRAFSVKGIVIEGDKIGTSIGYPTANLRIVEKLQVLPESGVFAVKIKIHEVLYNCMMNIGVRPTINDYGSNNLNQFKS